MIVGFPVFDNRINHADNPSDGSDGEQKAVQCQVPAGVDYRQEIEKQSEINPKYKQQAVPVADQVPDRPGPD